jgi:hypothetical protein
MRRHLRTDHPGRKRLTGLLVLVLVYLAVVYV